MRTVRIEVTAKDIIYGDRWSPSTCPIARAARRAGVRGARVGSVALEAENHLLLRDASLVASLPDPARAFVKRFDEGMTVEPFAFDVSLPDSAFKTEEDIL